MTKLADTPEIDRVVEAMIDAHRSTGAPLRTVLDAVIDRLAGVGVTATVVVALRALDEAAQISRGEIGEAVMHDGEAAAAGIERADRLLADGIAAANEALDL